MQHTDQENPVAADLVLRGGTVLALDAADTRAAAVAVRRGRIMQVGADAAIDPLIGPATQVVELAGRTVMPGVNDSHLHAAWLGATWPVTFFGAGAPGAGAPGAGGGGQGDGAGDRGGAGVQGTGTGDGNGADGGDGATGPAAGSGVGSGGYDAGNPHDGGAARRLVATEEDRRSAVLRAGELIASLGITSYTEPGIGPGEDAGETGCFTQSMLETYAALEAEGLLRARVNVLALFGILDGASDLESFTTGLRAYRRATPRPERLRVAGVKIFGDGIPPMMQAWTRHPYPDGGHGDLLVAGADIDEKAANLAGMVRLAHGLGYQVGVHATGDRTIDTVVAAVEEALREDPAELRHYIIHGDLVSPDALRRMARASMGLNVQSGIAAATAAWVEGVLGEEVTAAAWPIAAAMDAGVPLALSSDAPILAPDWRRGVADADAWMGRASDPHARMLALLRAYTVAPAWQDGAEAWKGTIERGKVADLCVLAGDPFEAGPADLPEIPVDLTVLDGEIVFDRARTPSA